MPPTSKHLLSSPAFSAPSADWAFMVTVKGAWPQQSKMPLPCVWIQLLVTQPWVPLVLGTPQPQMMLMEVGGTSLWLAGYRTPLSQPRFPKAGQTEVLEGTRLLAELRRAVTWGTETHTSCKESGEAWWRGTLEAAV